MNFRLLAKLLGWIALLIGGTMLFSLPWALPALGGQWSYERAGFWALLGSMAVCFTVGGLLGYLGRKAEVRLFRKEAMAVVGLSWVLATVLGAMPFLLSGTRRGADMPMSPIDAMFEAQSGFSTTGATVLTELEDPALVPRCILFWRSTTHLLGGLGIIVLFVAILGQGSAGKALMFAEMPGPSQSSQQARIQRTAWTLALIYAGLNALLTTLLCFEGLSLFDALCHAFGTMATGGFSTYNASVGHFQYVPGLNGPLIEMTMVVFMVLAGTNFTLIYLLLIRRPDRVWGDPEWRVYTGLLVIVAAAVVGFGLASGDFAGQNGMKRAVERQSRRSEAGGRRSEVRSRKSEVGSRPSELGAQGGSPSGESSGPELRTRLGNAVRYGLFQVVSIMTTTGFCTDDFDRWNSFARGVLLLLTFVGGCAGSTGGGLKVIRHILFAKILRLEVEQAFRPSVVRSLRVGGETVANPDLRRQILVYFGLILAIFVGAWLFIIALEPASTWIDYGHKPANKLIDAAGAVAATLNNIGPGLGVIGATKNYTHFVWYTKLMMICLMMLGRLELYVILVLFVPRFWRSQ